jgi:hypothetical protein
MGHESGRHMKFNRRFGQKRSNVSHEIINKLAEILFILQPRIKRQNVPQKHKVMFTRLHGDISKKTHF